MYSSDRGDRERPAPLHAWTSRLPERDGHRCPETRPDCLRLQKPQHRILPGTHMHTHTHTSLMWSIQLQSAQKVYGNLTHTFYECHWITFCSSVWSCCDRLDKWDLIVAELPSVTMKQTMWTTKCIVMIDLIDLVWTCCKICEMFLDDISFGIIT